MSESDIMSFQRQFIYLNYNLPQFVDYLLNEINEELEKCNENEDKLEKLILYLKSINQEVFHPGPVFLPRQPGIKDFLVEWLSDEISYYQDKTVLSENCNLKKSPVEQKFEMDISVPKIAFIFKVFVETGILLNKNKESMFKLCSSVISAKIQKNISWKSFRKEYNNVTNHTKEEVKGMLIKMVNKIHDL